MNIFKALFGIFRKGGLVASIEQGKSLKGFALSALLTAVLGSMLYGFSMGIGLGLDTAIKDAIKVGLIAVMVLIFSVPVFWISFRLLGREESMGHVNAVPLTMIATVTLILAVSSPVVFLLSILVPTTSNAIYIHIIIINLAILVGIYITGVLIYHTFEEHKRLVTPAIISISMMGVILIVGMMFFAPFLIPAKSFSEGTNRLKDGLGIDVDEKALQSLDASAQAESLTYDYVVTNENGDTIQNYKVTRIGDDYLIQVNVHTVAGEIEQHNATVWVLDGQMYTNFIDNAVGIAAPEELISYTAASTPEEIFILPSEFQLANWQGRQRTESYSAVATTANLNQATLIMDKNGRLESMVVGSAEGAVHSEKRITNIVPAELTRSELEASLNSAIKEGTFIGVYEKVKQGLSSATTAFQLAYRYQTAYINGDIIQDYSVTKVGNDYLIQIHYHAVPGENLRENRTIWIIDGIAYSDFNDGVVAEEDQSDLSSFLDGVLPASAFTLSSEFSSAVWQGSESSNLYTAVGTSQNASQTSLTMDANSGQLSEMVINNNQPGSQAVVRIKNIAPATLDRVALETSLNQATIAGFANISVAFMDVFVQVDHYFLVRYPDTWEARSWNLSAMEIEFNQDCPDDQECANLKVSVLGLVEDQELLQYAQALAENLDLQPEYRKITTGEIAIEELEGVVVEYLFDDVEDGKLVTRQHIVYIFEGEMYRYHLNFNAPTNDIRELRDLFAEIAMLFTYLQAPE